MNKRIILFTIGLTVLITAFIAWRLYVRQSVVFSNTNPAAVLPQVLKNVTLDRPEPAKITSEVRLPLGGLAQQNSISNPNQSLQDVQRVLQSVNQINNLNKTHEQITNPEKPKQNSK